MDLHHFLGGKKIQSSSHSSRTIRRRAARSKSRIFLPLSEALEDRTLLATMLWVNDANGDWNTGTNWVNQAESSDHHVPTSADDAQINFSGISVTYASGSDTVNSVTSQANLNISGGTLSISANSTISGNLTMSAGTLSPVSSITVSGAMAWTGGSINGGGTLTTQGTLTLGNATAAFTETLSGATLDNAGSATLAGTNSVVNYGLVIANGATFDNLPGASFTFQTDAEIFGTGGSSTIFKNEGMLTKAGGSATSPVSSFFNQTSTGTLQVESGTLQLSTGGGTIGGSVFVSSGKALNFNSGTYNLDASSTLAGAGNVSITGGTVNEAGTYGITGDSLITTLSNGTFSVDGGQAVSIPAVSVSGGTLSMISPAALTVSGAMAWTGGSINGGGTLTTQGTLTLGNATAAFTENLSGATLDNAGSATLAGTNSVVNYGLVIANGATFDNLPGASFTFQTDAEIFGTGGSSTIFKNEGMLTKAGGSATSPVSSFFNQTSTGTLQVESGTLQLSTGGGTIGGSVFVSSGKALNFNSGTYNLDASSTLAGAGNVSITGGTVNEAGTYGITGDSLITTLSNGTFSVDGGQAVSIPAVSVSGGTLSMISPAALTVSGAMAWTGGSINGGGTLTTQGTLTLGNATAAFTENLSGATLDNAGSATLAGTNSVVNYGLVIANGATFDNLPGASFTFQTDAEIFGTGGSSTIFKNEGMLTKAGGSATSPVSSFFNQTSTGTLQVESGTLQLSTGGGTIGGSVFVSSGKALNFNSGTYNLDASSTLAGAGNVSITGGTVNEAGTYGITGDSLITTLSNGTFSVDGGQAVSIPAVSVSGGTLSMISPAALTVSGAMAWTGGSINGGGTLTTQGTLTLGNATAAFTENLSGATLDNAGSATLAGTNSVVNYGLVIANGATFDNLPGASFTFQTDAEIFGTGGSSTIFKNEGMLTKAGGSATSPVSSFFNQTSTGTLQVESGTLQLSTGGGTIGGSVFVSSGKALNFNSGTYNLDASSTLAGAGNVSITGGTVNEAGTYGITGDSLITVLTSGTLNLNGGHAVTMPALTMSSGTLSVTSPASLTVSGAMTWTGGTINGGGTLTTQGTLALGSASAFDMEFLVGATLDNAGTATFSVLNGNLSYGLFLYTGALFDNLPGAGFTFQTDAEIYSNNVSSPTFKNEGTLTKAGGTATSPVASIVNQTSTGTVLVQSGTLQLAGGGTFAGTVQATGGGSFTMTTTPTNLSSGTLTGATWIVGTNSSMSLGANVTTDATAIVLNGTGASFSSMSHLAKVAAGASLQLLGGASLATTANLDNAGTVNLAPGNWSITGNYAQEATGALDVGIGGLAVSSQFGQLNVTGQASLNGALNISLLNGYSPPSGNIFRILTFGSRASDFAVETGLYIGGGEGFSPTYDSSGLNLVVIPEMAGTTTTVVSSLNPSTYGQSVTFTAAVAPTLSTSFTPTGTVTFYDGASTLGTAPMSGGTASFTTSMLVAGSHSIIAEYVGDSNFSGSNSTALTQTVNPDSSGTITASSLNPSTYGQSVTLTATVTASPPGSGTPTGSVTFYDGSTSLGTVILSSGTASISTSAFVAGSHPITASYGGDANFTASTSTAIAQVVNPDGTTTTLISSSVNPSDFGQSVTFSATVAAAAPGSGTPTGSITFYDGPTSLGTASLSGGSASLTSSALAVGSHSISAVYGGNANFTTSTSTSLTQGVNQDGSASVVVGVPYPSVIGQAVTFTATVTANAPGSGTPTGSVTFYDGATVLNTATLSGGSASFATSALALGSHPITAVYGGDTNFTGSTSQVFTQVVNEYASTTAVSSPVEPSVYGQSVTFTATVSATVTGEGTPTGSVTFYDGPTALDTETLSGGSATFATSSLSVGSHLVTAVYGGDSSFNGSNSTSFSQVVNQDGSATVVTSSVDPSVVTQAVTFTATVTASAPGSGTPTGTVIFYDGSTALGSATLSGGSAAFRTTALALGDHAISADYGGDASFTPSTSTAITATVNLPPPATLNGEVYNDLSGVGILASGDPGLFGWTVQLLDSSNSVVATTTTDGSGDYSFTGVYPGSYTVAVIGQAGYDPTDPPSQTLAVTAASGQTISGLDFGEFQAVTIGGEVYSDLNGDGALDQNESGLSGWTVTLVTGSNQVLATATTDANGGFSFTGVGPGTYTVQEAVPSGYVQTSAPASPLAAQSGLNVGGLNIGLFQKATVSGTLFEDSDQDGVLDNGEAGLPCWTIDLVNHTNQVIASTRTDSQGDYSFMGLAPGSYSIRDILQTGYIQTAPTSGSYSLTPTSGQQATREDFGVFKAVSLAVTGLTTVPSTLQSSDNVIVEWSDTNTGTLPAVGSFTDMITVTNTTTGQVLGMASVPYNATTLGNLAAGASAPQQYAFRLPDGNPGVGQIQITVTTDVYNNVSTPQGDPGKTATLTEPSTLAPYPDLAVAAVSSPVEAWSGRGIVVNWTVANQGQAVTQGTWNDVVYLNQAGSSGLGQQLGVFGSPESLSPGHSYQRTQDFTLPQGISGSYQIIVTSDASGSVYDPSPGNNTGVSALFPIQLTPSPDLQVSAIIVPPTAADFEQATVSWTVTNNGTGGTNVPSWNDEVFLSRDQTLSADDILLGTARNLSALAPGESYVQSLTALISGNYSGPYFGIVVADLGQTQREYPFNNDNVTASSGVVDVQTVPSPGFLSVSQMSVSPSPGTVIHGGDFLTVNWTAQNTGSGVVTVGQKDVLRTYLGGGVVEDQIDGATIMHDHVNYTLDYHPPLLPFAPSGSTISSGGGTPGYWIVNDSSSGVVNQTVIQNGSFVSHPGVLISGWVDALYLSQTATVGAGAIPVAFQDDSTDPVQNPTLSIGESYSQFDTIQLPAHMSGTWYVIVVPNALLTATASRPETSDEGSVAVPITATPAPQLQVDSVNAPATGVGGQPIPVTWTVSNQGFASSNAGMLQAPGNGSGPPTASQWTDAVYLSTSTTLVTSGAGAATLLGTFQHVGNLSPLQVYTETQQVTLPSDIQGPFYIFVEADSTNNVFEAADTYGSPLLQVTNYDPTPINITPPPPADLQVTSIAVPSSAGSGLPVSVGWTVTNTGSGSTSIGSWIDQLTLSADDDVTTTADNISLGSFSHTGSLGSGGQYTTGATVTIPVGISGTYYLFVTADANNQAAGFAGEVNNFASIDLPITLTSSPHLQITDFQLAGPALSGQPLPLEWTVTNIGNGPTRPSETSWTDRIYLSMNGVFDSSTDALLGGFTHNGGLAASASYTQSQAVTLPVGISGPYTLFLVVDAFGQVYQSGVTIDSQALPISVTLSPPPDLEVSDVSAPFASFTDQNVTINWTVTNNGAGPAAPATWDDSVYLSTDQFLTTSSAILLGSVQHQNGLAAGANYSGSLTAKIPDYASGPYYVFVVTDSGNAVFEATPSGSHQSYDPTALLVTMAPPSDLTVTAITVPATGIAGQLTATPLTWTVTNVGSNAAVGRWADNVYLSPDGSWNASDPLIGQFFHDGDLAPGSSYTVQDNVEIPGVLAGNYFVVIRTDALGNERDADRTNNQLTSTDTISTSFPTLTLGQTITPPFGPPFDLYYQFDAQAGQTIDISGEVPSQTTAFEFFIRYGAPPTFDQFDQETIGSQQQLQIRDAQQGTYYVLFHDLSSASGPTQIQIGSKIETFEVDSVSPALGSNVGQATVTITGAEFTPGAIVSLIAADGTTRTASQVWWKDSGTLWATFDLTGISTGSYEVSVADGGQTVSGPGAFTVTDGEQGFLKFHLLVPSAMRLTHGEIPGFGEAEVVYTNPGDTDVVAPLLILSGLTGNPVDNVKLRLPGQTTFGGDSVLFLGLNTTGPAGVIPPRSSFTYTIDFSLSELSAFTMAPVEWSLNEAPTASMIDWPSQEAGLQLPTIPNAAWPAVFANFVASVGPSWGTYVAALANDATYLSQLGTYNESVDQLLSFEIEKANAAFTAQSLVSVTADSLPASGMTLAFIQSFQQSIAGRYRQGILGYGWTNNWDIYAITTANGDVAIYNDGVSLFYTLQTDGSYADEVGDHSVVTLVEGAYQLVTTHGTRYQFNTNGTLGYVEDANGNRITAGYNPDGQMVSLTDSSGEYIALTYDTQGHLAQLADSSGQTETYGYDPTGQFLASYTDIYGTTDYIYITGQSPQRDNALAEIAYASGTALYFSYDAQGRLIDQMANGGAEAESFSYLNPGGYTVTDGNGNTSTILFNIYGATSEVITPKGDVVSYKYDSNLNLIEVDGPQGTNYTGTYDANGNLTSVTDPLGQMTKFVYDGNNNLTSYTDAKGNSTGYSYNSSNDLISITHANGAQQQYSYDPLGEATRYLNARGQAIGYTYNMAGLVAQATFPDGTSYSYTYDNHGNLTSATDSQNNVTMFLYGDPSNPKLLTKVEYTDGTYLQFNYNVVGQRTQSVDQTGFTVNYSYDAVGRLSELTDSSGSLIVQYTYDPTGNLIQKDMGNGTRTLYTYDADGNVLSIVNLAPDHSTVNSFDDYTYDVLGNVLTDTNRDGEWTYTYRSSAATKRFGERELRLAA